MAEERLITVFTPTYNRRALLRNCYESLLRQTCKRFLWLVVDDGSTDGTEDDVRQWAEDARGSFEIRFIRQKNGGLHTAYNTAIAAADTELFVCIDSDDYLTNDAVEVILNEWQRRGNDEVAGIVALNRTPDREVLGRRLPELDRAHIIALRCRYGCTRDLKMIYRTAALKHNAPIPVFDGELDLNPYYLFLKIDKRLPMLLLDQPVCVVNYQSDGMGSNIPLQYEASPNGFAELRLMMMSMPPEEATWRFIWRNAVHYVSSAVFAHRRHFIAASPHPVITAACVLPGLALNLLIRLKNRKKRAGKC